MGTCHVAVPVASVVSSGETIGSRFWIVTVNVAVALASGPPLTDVAWSVSSSVVGHKKKNLVCVTARWAVS